MFFNLANFLILLIVLWKMQVIRFLSLKFTLKGKSHSLERIRCFCLLAEDKEVTTALLYCGWGWQIKKAEEGKASMLWAEALPEATDAAKESHNCSLILTQ